MERKLTIVFFDAGGGHRSAAEALKSVLENQEQPWSVELLNLQEQLDKLDIEFYALRKDGEHAAGSLWGSHKSYKVYSVNDGGESRHEPCVFLYGK